MRSHFDRVAARSRRSFGRISESTNWWLNPAPRPSFLHKYEAQRRVYRAALQAVSAQWGELWTWETKIGLRTFAEDLGLPTPELYRGPLPLSELNLKGLPNEFVLKPSRGYGRNGVFVLRRKGDGFVDLLQQSNPITENEIIGSLAELGRAGLISTDDLIVERALLLEEKLSFDWKVYAFQGDTPLILQISRGRHTLNAYYDDAWNHLGEIRRGKRHAHLPLPENPAAILELASSASKALPIPFARIDILESCGEAYLGEISPVPGGRQRFKRELDLQLGLAWEKAEARLLSRPH